MNLFHTTIGEGPPILFMHGGLGLDHTYFRPWLDPLARNHTLIFFDHPGNGRSPDPERWEGFGLRDFAEQADQLRQSLGYDRITLLGHSFGGFVAQEYALAYPDRLDRLILCSVAPAIDYAPLILEEAQRRGSEAAVGALIRSLSSAVASDDEAETVWRRILPLYFHDPDPEGLAGFADRIRFRARAMNLSTLDLLPQIDFGDRLAEIDVPTLVISGDDEFIMPVQQAAQRLHDLVPGSSLEIIAGAGHFPWVENPGAFLGAVSRWPGWPNG